MAYRTKILDSGGGYQKRLLVGTAATGLVRMEWVQARYGQVIPVNWSMVQYMQFVDGFIPLRYQVAEAQNLIVDEAVKGGFEWLLLIEHDNVLPEDAFIRFNEYMTRGEFPVVSGLYYTRSMPSQPLVFRGDGTGVFTEWTLGQGVMVDRVPTGVLLIHCSILRAMWGDAEEYETYGRKVRRVFRTPRDLWFDPETGEYNTTQGTSDMRWSRDVIEGGYLAGWDRFENLRWPFLVDTNIFAGHIDPDGVIYPPRWRDIRTALARAQAAGEAPLAVNTAEILADYEADDK